MTTEQNIIRIKLGVLKLRSTWSIDERLVKVMDTVEMASIDSKICRRPMGPL